MPTPPESSLVFNVVWTGGVFSYLRFFVCSLMRHTDARFRFVANGCTPASVQEMRRFADRHGDQVVEVVEVSDQMGAHGLALDTVFRSRDDGDHFCFVDADIKAKGPFVADLGQHLADHAGVSSGKEVWADSNVLPRGAQAVGGRHFFDEDGFTFGSPHLAMYRRDALDETFRRWGVGFASAGPELEPATRARLAEAGRDYKLFDTGKIVNILLQCDGQRLLHTEHPDLLHVGGMSHYLSPPAHIEIDGVREPDWARWAGMEQRHAVARYTAAVLRASVEGQPAPPVPDDVDVDMAERLQDLRAELVDLVAQEGGA